MKRILTDNVRRLNLPSGAFAGMCDELYRELRDTTEKHGSFLYLPMMVMNGGRSIELVGAIILKRMRLGDFKAEKGDLVFWLRSEWNEDENPL